MYLAKGLVFVEPTHQFFLGEKELPSVTRIIRAVGMMCPYMGKPGPAARRGAAIHAALKDHLEGKPTGYAALTAKVDTVIAARGLTVVAAETPVCDRLGRYAGIPDLIVKDGSRVGIIEMKSGEEEDWHRVQTGGYMKAVEADFGILVYVDGPVRSYDVTLSEAVLWDSVLAVYARNWSVTHGSTVHGKAARPRGRRVPPRSPRSR